MSANSESSLSRLFHPRSIAVVGASATPGKIGAMPITLLRQHGYDGGIIPINPRADTVQGLPAYPDLAALDGETDLIVLAVPAEHAADALAHARPGQAAGAVVFTSGFAEAGEPGRAAQQRLVDVARSLGIRLLGPNCLGFMNVRDRVYATFTPAAARDAAREGGIGMVSQSGAFGAYAYSMAQARGLGLSYWISTGNEADIDVADCIAWLAGDPRTRVIMTYMEGCRDGGKLRRALDAARDAGKPVVVTKIGRTQAGARAAASHTAALAGDDAVYDALFRQHGALRARTIEEFFNLGYALDTLRHYPRGKRLAILSISGGVGALMADEASDAGLGLPEPAPAAQARLLQHVPFASARNPIDVTGQAVTEPGLLWATAQDVLGDGQYDAVAVFLAAAGSSPALWPTFEAFAQGLRDKFPEVPAAICALFPVERQRQLEQQGCLVFADPSAAIRTLGVIASAFADTLSAHPAPEALDDAVATLDLPAGGCNEVQAMDILRQAGIPAPALALVGSADQAVAAAAALQGPAVLKIVSPDIAHKSDVGGVKVGVAGEPAVRDAYAGILAAVRGRRPDARIDGVLVAPLLRGGVECIAGAHLDPVFGPVVMFGLGGVFVEVLKDVSFRLAPFGRDQALGMIREIRGYTLLQGARGEPPCDIDAIADVLVALSRFAYRHRASIGSVEINPLLARPRGQGVVALDAVIAPRP
ncbi:acetate--CoA ligase family protein [Bordetella genomosp. 11]|uniref:6-carboxyhexanoate--CoA ligase n=1 Tax=Bordetella genomosp. 11 TaxID=1416808 RepID=A0A261UFD5_9BORD|nr:acetate--CoA ligase family protein [Bordetella genomosp. 11]OZI60122.1 6-carboxyhexanoate--CoA ligase [Bordetella genomosp. 11]